MYEAIKDLNPEQVAIAFDPAHAFIELGDGWKAEFDRLRSHFKIAYVKDANRGTKRFVRFGEGDLGRTDFFKLLRTSGYQAPISMHTEYEWTEHGQAKDRAGLVQALRADLKVLKEWLGPAL
ncbi:MAG: sugar phosphate isomerase/epimerase [Verrucomicrobia bacterium]|nr:sugar phosphate isomerase/epimerase [Verrucomicrobiota bacterium]